MAVDLIAERIRALGYPAPGTYAAYAKLSSIKEEQGVPSAEDMIKQLVSGQEQISKTARSVFPAAEKAGDEPTADLLTQRMQLHEKNAWMLRSLAEQVSSIEFNGLDRRGIFLRRSFCCLASACAVIYRRGPAYLLWPVCRSCIKALREKDDVDPENTRLGD